MSTDQSKKISVTQGEFKVSSDPNVTFTAVLGSCVSACAYDPRLNIGGMNHFLLPGDSNHTFDRMLGAYLMELLLNELFKNGASKDRLQIKLFGGAKLMYSRRDPGTRNVEFIQEFAAAEGLNVVASSLGKAQGRLVEFVPSSGRTRQKFLPKDTSLDIEASMPVQQHAPPELELF